MTETLIQQEGNSTLFEYLLHYSSIVFLVTGKDGTIILANDFSNSLTGKKLEGLNLSDVFISFGKPFDLKDHIFENSNKILINIANAAQMPGTWYFQFFDIGNTVMAIGDANNLEIELLRKNQLELNQELNNLTRELHKKNAELNKLNELKNQFLGIAAHDLRNPLNIIMGYSSFLLEEAKDHCSEDQILMIKSIFRSSEFMLKLLNDLLDITAIESGKLNLDLTKTDLIPVIKHNILLNSVIAKKKNIIIHFDCLEIIPEITFDISKIEQVLDNLISNAVKYSMPGTCVNVNLFMSGDHVTISVTDHGQGIPENELEWLFKPFKTTSVKSTAGEISTGLGLSIVRKLIMGHNGKIWVESKVGVGSAFFFSLPVGN